MFAFTAPVNITRPSATGGLQTAAELDEAVRITTNHLATVPVAAAETFASQITAAARRFAHPGICATTEATSEASEGGFGEQIRRAAEKHPNSRKAAAERAERNRARYHKRQRRKPTKSG